MLYWFRETLLLASIGWTLWAWRRIPVPRQRPFGLLGVIAGSALVVELVGLFTTVHRVNNSIIYNLFIYAEFMLQLGMIQSYTARWKPFIVAAAIIGTVFWCSSLLSYSICEFLFIEAIIGFAVLIIMLCILNLWQIARITDIALHRMPPFWIFGGLLVYHGSLLPVLSIIHYLFTNDDLLASWLWYIPPFLCILRYTCFATACILQASQD